MEGRKFGLIFAGTIAGILLAVWLFSREEDEPLTIQTLFDPFVRGARLNHSTLNSRGFIDQAPYELVGEASEIYGEDLPEDLYALARSGRSEGRNGMEARMHVFLNQAQAEGRSLFDLATREPGNPGDGYYGEQRGRRWSTSRDPYAGDVDLAKKVLADRAAGRDPTGGAGRYFDKSAFGAQKGTEGVTWEQRLSEWEAKGYVAYYYADASRDFVLFRQGSAPQGFEQLA